MPVLVANYRKNLVETRLKETYSILNQMMYRAVAENGESINWNYPAYGNNSYTDKDFFDKYLSKFITVTRKCNRNEQTDYKSYLCRLDFASEAGTPINWSNLGEKSPKYILPNGTSFYIDTLWGSNSQDTSGPYIIFVVDLNINKNQALFGRDVFLFHYLLSTEKLQSSRYMSWNNHGRSCGKLNENRNTVINECRSGNFGQAGGGYDGGCTTLIMCNNWEIPKDYPIKF